MSTAPNAPMMRKYRLLQQENEQLRERVKEFEEGRDLMSMRDVAEYLGFTMAAVHMLMDKDARGDRAVEDRLPAPLAHFETSTVRVWNRADIVEYGERLGRDRGYKNTKRKRGEASG